MAQSEPRPSLLTGKLHRVSHSLATAAPLRRALPDEASATRQGADAPVWGLDLAVALDPGADPKALTSISQGPFFGLPSRDPMATPRARTSLSMRRHMAQRMHRSSAIQ